MKSGALKVLLPFALCPLIAGANCAHFNRRVPESLRAEPTLVPSPNAGNTVSYKGVSFKFDRSVATEVKAETIAAMTDSKPSDIVPEHPAFKLAGYPRARSMVENDPEIRVFSVAKFREAMHQASVEMNKNTYPSTGDWGPDVDEEVRVLNVLLSKRPARESLKEVLAKAWSPEKKKFNDFPQMPFLPFWEASQALAAHVRYLNFQNGKGVFFLTQWNVGETSQVTNDGLEYAYQGITDDSQYYIYAEFSVAAPFLPKDDDPEVAAWNTKHYLLPQNSKQYQDYLRPVLAKLEELPANKFQPNLELLEQLIQSLEVKDK